MDIFQVIVLAVVQGLTEFIPVSSSGHLSLIPQIFGWSAQPTSFDIVLHAGTLLALLIAFRVKIRSYVTQAVQSKNFPKVGKFLLASIPAIIFGGIITLGNKITNDSIDNIIKSPFLEVFFLIGVGILMIGADYIFKNNKKEISKLSFVDSLIIGLGQSIALLRGVSRSGITILFGQGRGLDRKNSAEFAFLIGIPVLVFGFVYQIFDFLRNGTEGVSIAYLALGFLISFVTGYFAINFLLNFLKNHGLAVFGVYRIIFAIIILIVLL